MVGPAGRWKQREHLSLFLVLLKLTITYGKGRTLVIFTHQQSLSEEGHR
jgi:hypothetical protein